ncbi:hypothetical protein AAU61_04295 [Desulfocarbo indianensis]|nr:hypothetical protein AAU61_04295 [Desulfocarbo indianensis]
MTDEPKKKLPGDFDTTAELWDRIADDVALRGTPCFDTVEDLLKDSCEAQTGAEEDGRPPVAKGRP